MKKLICILASAALLGACEQKTDVVAPASPAPEKKVENNTTVVNPTTEKTKETKETTNTNTTTTSPSSNSSSTSTTTTTSSPSP
ncbi:MAG: hypothetical protein QOG12_774 [Verrucomicrobiota bacterium]